ncbi:MAG TPA: hypothetical protein VGC34_12755 [Steroidobacteraceae bacterium]
MYLASFNHGGRDLVGVRWGDDELVPLEHLLPGRYTAGGDGTLTDGMLALIASGPSRSLNCSARLSARSARRSARRTAPAT